MTRLLVVVGLFASLLDYQAAPPGLRIVVLEGEDAVNVIQQKTAVQPLVEVRDRNNLPVAGATVTFTIGSGSPAAFAGGVQTFTITTNAAGQAAAGGLNVLGNGAVQIQVQAAYQGQIATAAISQTNVATAAAASQAGTASGGAAGGGGGISGTTIGIVGGAVAVGGGVIVATQVTGGDDSGSEDSGSLKTYTGPIAGQAVFTTTTSPLNSAPNSCQSTRTISGTMKIQLQNGNTSGFGDIDGTITEISVTQSGLCSPQNPSSVPFKFAGNVTGGPSNLTFTVEQLVTGNLTVTNTVKFTGALSGDTITGTVGYVNVSQGTVSNGSTITGNASTSMPVTLRP
jgi:hypothetical protein